MLENKTLSMKVSINPSIQYRNLIWDVFFNSRNRGVNLLTHFPWLNSSNEKVWFMEIWDVDDCIGGAVVIEQMSSYGNVACIGLVCIKPFFQGLGFSKKLFQAIIIESQRKGLDGLTLWTSKHSVYIKHGFELRDSTVKATIELSKLVSVKNKNILTEIDWINDDGLPPFALKGIRYKIKNSEFTLLYTPKEIILSSWFGDNSDIEDGIASLNIEVLSVQLRTDSSLFNYLKKRKLIGVLEENQLQMWLLLNKKKSVQELSRNFYFGLLDRI